jgi:hypothetical protein
MTACHYISIKKNISGIQNMFQLTVRPACVIWNTVILQADQNTMLHMHNQLFVWGMADPVYEAVVSDLCLISQKII